MLEAEEINVKRHGKVLAIVAGLVALVSTATSALSPGSYAGPTRVTAPGATGSPKRLPETRMGAPPPVNAVTLTPNLPSPQALNTTIVWTAVAKGGTAPQYRFWVQPVGGPFTLAQDYGPSNTFAWMPAAAGNYFVILWARGTGSSAPFEADKVVAFQVTPINPITAVSLSPDGPSPQAVGTQIVWTATPTGGSAPEFQFWVRSSGRAWALGQAYSRSNTFPWALTRADDYDVCVWARSGGSPALWEAFGCEGYTVMRTPRGGPITSVALAAGAFILGVPLILMRKKSIRERVGRWLVGKPVRIWSLPFLLLAYYTMVALAVDQWNLVLLLVLAGYFGLPTLLLYLTGPKSDDTIAGRDLVINFSVVLWIWLLIELRVVPNSWVRVKIGTGNPTGVPLGVYAAMTYALLVFSGWRKFDLKCDLSFERFYLRPIVTTTGALGVVLLLITLPAGLAEVRTAQYIELNPFGWPWAIAAPIAALAGFLIIFFGVGLVEELVFRGAIQNLLGHYVKPAPALLIASAVFGLAHLNDRAFGLDFPNCPYVGLATIAGLGYGFVFRKTNSIVASATVHTLIDLIWILFLGGGK